MGKSTTYFVWSDGTVKSLQKATKHFNMEIVSPLWLQDCIENQKIMDAGAYRPLNLEKLLKNSELKKNEQEGIKKKIFKRGVGEILNQSRITEAKYQQDSVRESSENEVLDD